MDFKAYRRRLDRLDDALPPPEPAPGSAHMTRVSERVLCVLTVLEGIARREGNTDSLERLAEIRRYIVLGGDAAAAEVFAGLCPGNVKPDYVAKILARPDDDDCPPRW